MKNVREGEFVLVIELQEVQKLLLMMKTHEHEAKTLSPVYHMIKDTVITEVIVKTLNSCSHCIQRVNFTNSKTQTR